MKSNNQVICKGLYYLFFKSISGLCAYFSLFMKDSFHFKTFLTSSSLILSVHCVSHQSLPKSIKNLLCANIIDVVCTKKACSISTF